MKKDHFFKSVSWIALLIMLSSTLLAACAGGSASSAKKPIVVASKDFTEEFIIGNMYADALENAGFQVTRKMNLGGTPVCQQALLSNEIDLYPEYTGTGLLTVLKLPTQADPQAVYQTVKQEYQSKWNLIWLQPAPMNDSQAIAVTQATAQKYNLKTLSDFAANASQLVLAGPPEFETRADGLPGLKQAYGDFTLKAYKSVDPGLRYQALTSGQADAVVAFTTDGEISADNLVVLQDDQHLFPPYNVAPVVRNAVLQANPGIQAVLDKVDAQLTTEVMSQLNYEVTGQGKDPAVVAQDFLKQQGLIK